jgi:hypothetical protein
MAFDNPNELDRQTRRTKKKAKREQRAGNQPHSWQAEYCPPDLAEKFWDQLEALDQSPQSTHFKQLGERGIALPSPVALTDEQIHAKLWEVIKALADMNVFVCSTNHLNDRELYERLWSDVLHEWTMDADLPDMTCHLDMVGSGSDHDIAAWLRYYAGPDDRERWQKDFPGHALPPRAKAPFNRDRQLPRPREL